MINGTGAQACARATRVDIHVTTAEDGGHTEIRVCDVHAAAAAQLRLTSISGVEMTQSSWLSRPLVLTFDL